MKNTKKFILIISLFVCLTHTMGLCFVSHSPQVLETRNWQLETDSYDITAGAIPKPTLQRTALNTFDAADRLVSSSVRYGQGADSTEHITETFQYDGNGALTNWLGSPLWKGGGGNAAGGLSLTYDALGRLLTDGEALTCTYDALGNRLQTVGCCSITPEIWIPNHADPLKRPLMMYDAEGDEVYYYYIWGGNRLLGVIENGEFWDESDALFVAHSDEIGSVIAFTDMGGNLLYSANYGPHGEDWGSTGFNPTPFTWLGGYGVQYLETDTPLRLYLTRHRVYSATLNRFLSADPIGLAGGNNLYAYGEGNPMAYIDPLGLCGQDTYQTPEFRAPTAWELETWGMSDWEKDKLFLDFFKGSVFEDEVRQVMLANGSQFVFAQKTAEEMFGLVASMSVGGAMIQSAEKAAATAVKLLPAPRGPNPWAGNITSTVTTKPLAVERFAGAIKSPWVQLEGAGGTPATLSISPGNSATAISRSVIPVGTRIQYGAAAPVTEWGGLGGARQIQILNEIDWYSKMIWEVTPR